jgi:hypothetical protein
VAGGYLEEEGLRRPDVTELEWDVPRSRAPHNQGMIPVPVIISHVIAKSAD